ncbi:hypothetical protein AUJ68_03395 [Candidatus Woesearchaeota archaeon CG1_02_57_44]|nr:MAG: hypothetical protein AUJ68_03395 [Candidatus Woesearchaeota archaeon CG1_02_57_44]
MRLKGLFLGILLILVLYSIAPLWQQGVPATDDFRHHLTKFWFLKEAVSETGRTQEWMPYIYSGWPFSQFYHSLPYYGSLPLILMMNPVTALKWSIILSMILSTLGMYWAAKIFTGRDDAALVASCLYALMPMRFEFAYYSGSISRLWGLIFLAPSLLFFAAAVVQRRGEWYRPAAAAYSLLILSNVNMAYTVAWYWLALLVYRVASDARAARQGGAQADAGSNHDAAQNHPVARVDWRPLAGQLFAVLLIIVSLTAYFLLPLYAERTESTTFSIQGAGVFGGAPMPLSATMLLSRGFGLAAGGERHFYVGLVGMLLALAGVLLSRRLAHRWMLLFLGLFGLMVGGTGLITLLPFSNMAVFATYHIANALVFVFVLAGLCVGALARSAGGNRWIVFGVLLAVALLDVAPAARSFSWVNQPDAQFTNPPVLIDAWQWIAKQPGDFRVYSPIGQVPFMYHHKFEVGTEWMGYREGALQPIRKWTDDVEKAFRADPTSEDVARLLGYWGTRYYVLPCMDVPSYFTLAYQNGQACVYENGFYAPLVTGASSVVKAQVAIAGFAGNASTVLVDEACGDGANCTRSLTPAVVSDYRFDFGTITFTADSPGWVLVRSAGFKGHWSAMSGGKEYAIGQVWPKYMLLEVPAGEVVMQYHKTPIQLFASGWSFAALLFLLLPWLRIVAKRHKKKGKVVEEDTAVV